MFHRFANPTRFLRLADAVQPWLAGATVALEATVMAKVAAHWLTTGLPLIVAAPLLAVLMNMPAEGFWVLIAALVLGTPSLSLIGAIGGFSAKPQLLILTGLLVAALPLCPWVGAHAIRQALD